METNKKVYGVYFSKAEAEDAVRRLMDLGYSTDELVLEEETKITILIDSDREIIDSAVLDEELDNLNPEEKQSRIMKRIEKFNKIKGKETIDSRNITASVIDGVDKETDSLFDERGVLKDHFKEDFNNPKQNRLDAESYPYDRKVMSVSTDGDFSQKRYEPKELQKTKFRDGEFLTDEPENKE